MSLVLICDSSKGIWFSYATPKFAFLAWVAIHNRLSTGERMLRWGGNANTACSFCDEILETRYSAEVWGKLARGLTD